MLETSSNVKEKINVVKPSQTGPPNNSIPHPKNVTGDIPMAFADTGATGHFLALNTPGLAAVPTSNPIQVKMPDNGIITSTHTYDLDLLPLPKTARIAHLFPALTDTSLLSIRKLCDAGCHAHFDKDNVTITYRGNVLLKGNTCPHTRLWQVPLQTKPFYHQANKITPTSTAENMVKFSHAALFSPAETTLKTALENKLIKNFPGLTLSTLKKYPPNSTATPKGHLDQTRANQQSTKPKPTNSEEPADAFPPHLPNGIPTQATYPAIVPFEATRQVHTDQTGKFPVTSTRGMKYVFVLYDYDSNSIHPVPIKNRLAESILEAYKQVHSKLIKAGLKPKLHRLDNECSQILKDFMTEEQEDYQLVPPGTHRRNSAERAIRTFKNHFIAGLASTDPNFPLNLWDRLIEQSYITLNLLRNSRMNPKLSAYAQIEGEFDYNRTPLAPPGTRVVVHEKPTDRGTWEAHGVDGWYIGPAMESYRCFKTYIWSTKAERITDTVEWFPHHFNMPKISDSELLIAATNDILKILQNPSKNSPIPALTDSESHQLQQITQLLHNKVKPSPNPPLLLPTNTTTQQTLPPPPPPTLPSPAPLLRVPTKSIRPPASVLRVPNKSPHTPNPSDIPQVTQDEDLEPDQTNHYNYNKILRHKIAPRGSGSKYQVQVDWDNHKPTFVPINIFTDNGLNTTAWNSVAEYARSNNLTNTTGWKQFKLPTVTQTANTICNGLSKKCKEFFQVCLTAQELANKAVNPDTGKLSEYSTLLQSSDGQHWEESCCEEIGRLAQGYPPTVPQGTDTMHFIRIDQIPHGRKATYLRLVVADRPMKANPRRVRFTVGGDKVDYPFDVCTKTAALTTAKLLINSTISTPGARFMGIDIKDFYLNNPMSRYEYMRIPINQIPQKIIDLYNLTPLIHNGAVYVEIRKGMYGLPQAGRIANDKLVPILEKAGYIQSDHIPGLFKHQTRPISFCLVVDDFGVKYVGDEHAHHLIDTLKQADYQITTDWEGTQFCGIRLTWDYENGTVDLDMPNYIAKALQRFEHALPSKPQDSPHAWTQPNYGAKQQLTEEPDTSPPLDQSGIQRLQQVVGTLLFYARAIDNTMLVALGTLASAQTKGTEATMEALTQLLDYAASHPNAVIRYKASDMILYIHSDASYLSESEARSRAGGFFFLSNKSDPSNKETPPPMLNGAIHIVSTIMNNVMSSATEAEVGALFHNAQDACSLRTALEFLGHPQPPTPIQTDNATAYGIVNDTVKQKRSKAIDMRFYWVRDRVRQNQFEIYWDKGANNLGDYFTKHHSASHHRAMRPLYIHEQALSLISFPS